MSRGSVAHQRSAVHEAFREERGRHVEECNELRVRAERLEEENARLRDQLAEVEGWYRLLQVDHAALQAHDRRTSRRTTELQVEVNRLEAENRELDTLVARTAAAGQGPGR